MVGFEIFLTKETIYMLRPKDSYLSFHLVSICDHSVRLYMTRDNLEAVPPTLLRLNWNSIR